MIEVKIGDRTVQYFAVQTRAEEAYDGFGTFTILKVDERSRIALVDTKHLDWQLARYKSGLRSAEIVDRPTEEALHSILWFRLAGKKEE